MEVKGMDFPHSYLNLRYFCNLTDPWSPNPVSIYLFKGNNRNTRTRCEICSKLTVKTTERHLAFFTPYSSVFLVNFEQVNRFSHLVLVFFLLTLSR